MTNIGKKSFTTTVSCPKSGQLWSFYFRFVAIDDQRLEVINSLNNDVTGLKVKTFTFDHQNINALQGYVTVLSFGFTGYIDFSLTITSITQTKVTVQFKSTQGKITTLGFQVVLGTASILTISDLITKSGLSSSSLYQSDTLIYYPAKYLMMPLSEISIPVTAQIAYYMAETDLTDTLTYKYYSNGVSVIDYFAHRQVTINSDAPKFIPLQLSKLKIASFYDYKWASNPTFSFKYVEGNEKIEPGNSKDYTIDSTQQNLNFIVTCIGLENQKIYGTFLQCISCDKQNIIINQNFYGSINTFVLKMRFSQEDLIYKSININVTSSGFTLTQTIRNQQIETFTICSFSIQDQSK